MKRTLGILVGAISAVALAAGPAAAHSSALDVDPTLLSDGSSGQVTGTVTCTVGDRFLAGARVRQGGNIVAEGSNSAGNACTGSPQAVPVKVFGSLSAGSADATMTIFTSAGTSPHGTPSSHTETVTVVI